jgi:nicotinate-nucleotide--dimethylbenzimidazole phosphoribosyltransferase
MPVTRVGQTEPFEVLRRLGGSEHAVLAGAIAEARVRSIPVLLDGYVTTAAAAAALVRGAGCPRPLSGRPPVAGARAWPAVGASRTRTLLDLGLGLGEGSGALIALPIVRLAAASVVDVATFEEWGLA